MSLSVGIVGLPNVGKSTLFNALLKKQLALAANYPFATIEPNIGVTEVPDERLSILAELVHTTVIKCALVEFIDIAGLIKGASQGEGLGNKFLAHIRQTDAICHVLRDFTDDNVLREGSVDPVTDLATIRMELQLADLETVQKQPQPKGTKAKDELARWEVIQVLHARLAAGQNALDWRLATTSQLTEAQKIELQVAKELNLLTAKPELFAINVDESRLVQAEEIVKRLAAQLAVSPSQLVVISAAIESELATLATADQRLYLADLGINQSGLERLAQVAYQTLGLQSFLTAGEKEVRAWTIRQGSTAPQAAGVIHTDFAKKFIKAKVASYADFVKYRGWAGVKEAGKLRLEGKDYVMQEGDVVEFMVGT